MESVLIGNLLGLEVKDLQVWACLSMWESDSVITKYRQCFILSQLLQTKYLIPVCWCPLFLIRVNSQVMTHDDDMCVSHVEIKSWRHHWHHIRNHYHCHYWRTSNNTIDSRWLMFERDLPISSGASEPMLTEEFQPDNIPCPESIQGINPGTILRKYHCAII